MDKLLVLAVLAAAICGVFGDNDAKDETDRQKRLLFYDEDGNLVKTTNMYNNEFGNTADMMQMAFLEQLKMNPFLKKYLNPFMNFLKPSSIGLPMAFMIPVSEEVMQQMNKDPVYQNKLMTVPRQEIVVEPNPQCVGKRTQIPALNCKNYINCWDGYAVEQECPGGLMFSRFGYCDYSRNVDCKQRFKDPEPPSAQAQCSKEFETWRGATDCGEFFVCVDRTPVRFKCPANLAYSLYLGVCDFQERVDCRSVAGNQKPPTIPALPASPEPVIPALPATPGSCSPSPAEPVKQTPSFPAPAFPGQLAVPAAPPSVPRPDNSGIKSSTVFDSQTWSSSHVAISRQDAIRQMKLKGIANVSA